MQDSFEVLKNVDVMLGYKMLTSEGKEILAGRNPMNLIVNNYTSVKYDLSQNIFSAGVNVRFNKTSFLNVTYNRANNTTGVDANDYKMNQLFVNLTVKL